MLRLAPEAGQEISPEVIPLEGTLFQHHLEYLRPGLLVL